MESLRDNLEVNVIGVHAMIQAFLPLLQSGHSKTNVNISSGSGSLSGCYEEVLLQTEQIINSNLFKVVPMRLIVLPASITKLYRGNAGYEKAGYQQG